MAAILDPTQDNMIVDGQGDVGLAKLIELLMAAATSSPSLLNDSVFHMSSFSQMAQTSTSSVESGRNKSMSKTSSWVASVIQRSGLSQAVLHSLATSTELVHISNRFVDLRHSLHTPHSFIQ